MIDYIERESRLRSLVLGLFAPHELIAPLSHLHEADVGAHNDALKVVKLHIGFEHQLLLSRELSARRVGETFRRPEVLQCLRLLCRKFLPAEKGLSISREGCAALFRALSQCVARCLRLAKSRRQSSQICGVRVLALRRERLLLALEATQPLRGLRNRREQRLFVSLRCLLFCFERPDLTLQIGGLSGRKLFLPGFLGRAQPLECLPRRTQPFLRTAPRRLKCRALCFERRKFLAEPLILHSHRFALRRRNKALRNLCLQYRLFGLCAAVQVLKGNPRKQLFRPLGEFPFLPLHSLLTCAVALCRLLGRLLTIFPGGLQRPERCLTRRSGGSRRNLRMA